MIHSFHQSEDFRRDNVCLSTCFFWKEKASCMTGKGDFCGVQYDQERYHKSQRLLSVAAEEGSCQTQINNASEADQFARREQGASPGGEAKTPHFMSFLWKTLKKRGRFVFAKQSTNGQICQTWKMFKGRIPAEVSGLERSAWTPVLLSLPLAPNPTWASLQHSAVKFHAAGRTETSLASNACLLGSFHSQSCPGEFFLAYDLGHFYPLNLYAFIYAPLLT